MGRFKEEFFGHTQKELNNLLTSVFFMSVVFFVWYWIIAKLDITLFSGLILFIFILAVTFLSMFVHEIMHWYWARKKGYIYHYEFSLAGNIVSIFITFFFFGWLVFLAPGGTYVEQHKRLKLGRYQHGGTKERSFVSMVGPLSNFVIAFLLSFFFTNKIDQPLLYIVLFINLLIALFSLLPIPKYDGLNIFYDSRMSWAFLFALILIYTLLVLVAGITSLFLSISVAALILLGFWYFYEK